MSPLQFFLLMLLITLAAAGTEFVRRHRRVRELRRLAREWRMHYSRGDPFRLSARVAERLPVPGAAGVRVLDLLYGIENENYRFYFAAEYTIGVLRAKTGVRRIITFSEPKDSPPGAPLPELVIAPAEMPLVEQYEHLHRLTTEPSNA